MTNLRLQLNHAELELEHVIHDLEAATPCNQVAGQLLLAARRKAHDLMGTIRDALTRDVELEGPAHRRCPSCGESKDQHAAGCPAGVR